MQIRYTILAVVLLGLLTGRSVDAQYELSIPNVSGNTGQTVVAPVVLDSSAGMNVQGFSFGVCSDSLIATPLNAVPGADLGLINGGLGPDFFQVDLYADGYTLGSVISFIGASAIPPSFDYELVAAEYNVVGALGDVTPLAFCSALGNPPVGIAIIVNGASTGATLIDGSLNVSLPASVGFKFDTPDLAIPNSTVDAFILSDSTADYEGFTFGFTYDATQVTLDSIDAFGILAATNGGMGPDFFSGDVFPGGGIGGTVECTISTTAPFETIPAGLDQPIIVIGFSVGFAAGPACSVTPLEFSDQLGSPNVLIEAIVGGVAEPAGVTNGGLEIGVVPPTPPSGGITLSVENIGVTPGDDAVARVFLDNDVPVEAISFGVIYTITDLSLLQVEAGSQLSQVGCGTGPDFYSAQIQTGGAFGVTVAAVFGLQPPNAGAVLAPAGNNEIIRMTFLSNPSPVSTGSPLILTDTLGLPPVAIEVTVDGLAVLPDTVDGSITFGGALDTFVRGDCNDDGSLNIADAVFYLGSLFPPVGGMGNVPNCQDACDSNDDGNLDIADAITTLAALFSGGSIPGPNPCGLDPTDGDSLDCGVFNACP